MDTVVSRTFKFLCIGLAVLISLMVFFVIASLIWIKLGKVSNERIMAIDTPEGINVIETTNIGGIEQFIQIRGEDLDNPIILSIHGGPGSTNLPMAYEFQKPWEEHFTVVQWEQRGAGLTHGLHGEDIADTITFDRIVLDGIELAQYLLERFDKNKVILLGHSWGSMIGTYMVDLSPELFYAYVGVGQMVNTLETNLVSYEYVLEQSQVAGDSKGTEQLLEIGPPPWGPTPEEAREKLSIQQSYLMPYNGSIYGYDSFLQLIAIMLRVPYTPISYMFDYINGSTFSSVSLQDDLENFDLRKLDGKYELPMFFLLGANDY
ncbi:MAG: alpha/beta hydrolase [Gammaproteobacteria bacterium]|jgi:proline iminopeptidase|nr:alpha/beta hydrolase [Gammaproteobacteria bacterium]